jgi:flavin-dependent dehydrogenase
LGPNGPDPCSGHHTVGEDIAPDLARAAVSVTDHVARYDVAVLGSGPAGSAAAIELARHGQRVIVVEQSLYDDVRVGETIAPQAAPWLRRLGIEDAFASIPRVPAPRVVRLWERPALLADALSFENERNGWHVDRLRFDALLADEAEQAGAVVRRGAVVVSCEQRADVGWHVRLDSTGRRIDVEASWLIDATGRRRWLLRRLGVRVSVLDRLVGLLGYGGPRASSDPALFIEATPLGWWYSAPLPGQRSVAAFMTDGDLIPRDRRGVAQFWEDQRARSALISRLHDSRASVRTVVARTAYSSTVASGRWLAAGDSAMAFDPLFGLGICQALAAGWMSAHAVLEVSEHCTAAMSRYQSWSESQYADYLARRRRIYGTVTRWPDSPFWRRRAS